MATAPGSDPLVFQALAGRLTPPFLLLYVLHMPRGTGEPGRYQSPEIDAAALRAFLHRRKARKQGQYQLLSRSTPPASLCSCPASPVSSSPAFRTM